MGEISHDAGIGQRREKDRRDQERFLGRRSRDLLHAGHSSLGEG